MNSQHLARYVSIGLLLFSSVFAVAPPAPTLSSPPNNSTRTTITPKLQWTTSSGAASYNLQVSTTSTFSSFFLNMNVGNVTSYVTPSMKNNVKYYWKVDAVNSSNQTSPWSSVWTFYTVAIPATPVLQSPASNAHNISPSPILQWSNDAATRTDTLQFSTDPVFSSTNMTKVPGITGSSFNLYGLFNGKTYYWRVKAVNISNQASGWSATWSFTTRQAIATNGNGLGQTDVGIWYYAYSPSSMIKYWGSVPDFEPLNSDAPNDYGNIELSDDVINFHLEKIAEAKIDFIIIDYTNGGLVTQYPVSDPTWTDDLPVIDRVCKRLKVWNDTHSWQIRYTIAIGGSSAIYNGRGTFSDCLNQQAGACYNNYVVNNVDYGGANNWYYLDGKPLLVVFLGGDDEATYKQMLQDYAVTADFPTSSANNFTIRFAGVGQQGFYGWPAWGCQNDWFNNTNSDTAGTKVDNEVELVSPGYNWHNARILPKNYGQFYSHRCWDIVLANKRPRIVVIASFNDYWEQTGVWTAHTNGPSLPTCEWFGPNSSTQQPDMYWNLTKGYILGLRGDVTPVLNTLLGD